MKKVLMLVILGSVLLLGGCEKGIVDELKPFKSYEVIEKNVVDTIEEGLLEKETEKNGLSVEVSSVHVISFTKIGSYARGEARMLGAKNGKPVNYNIQFEYSYKTGSYSWNSNYRN